MVATGETLGLAEWIIDDACIVEYILPILIYVGIIDVGILTNNFWPTRPQPNRWSFFSHMVSVRSKNKN